jgi:3-deoxy-7-phosphoheptulonate synthase
MIVHLEQGINDNAKQGIVAAITDAGFKTNEVKTQSAHYLVCIGSRDVDLRRVGYLQGVKDVFHITDAYKLVSRTWRVEPTTIDLGDGVSIGEGSMAIMLGPCSIENEEKTLHTVEHLKEQGVRMMRGGVFKPRSSPYAFRGSGIEGLKMFHAICKEHGIKIITEVMEISQIEPMYPYIDVFQVGARNSQNFNLLDALGSTDKPVMIKRGISGTIEELLYSAEYVFSGGNEKVILCERGIRTFERAARNTFDVNAIPILKDKSHLPVVVDPSHGVGIRDYVIPIALAGVIAGADGVIAEIHERPEEALSDSQQTLSFQESAMLIDRVRKTFDLRQSFSA